MQAPKPQAIPDSSASWPGTLGSTQSARTASSIGSGPQAKTVAARSRSSSARRRSVTSPAWPTEPSSVASAASLSNRPAASACAAERKPSRICGLRTADCGLAQPGTAAARRLCRRRPAAACPPAGGSPGRAARRGGAPPPPSARRAGGCRGRSPRAGSPAPRRPRWAAPGRTRTRAAGRGARPRRPSARRRTACRTGPGIGLGGPASSSAVTTPVGAHPLVGRDLRGAPLGGSERAGLAAWPGGCSSDPGPGWASARAAPGATPRPAPRCGGPGSRAGRRSRRTWS